MKRGRKAEAYEPGYSECSKKPLNFVEKGIDAILPVLQKGKATQK